MIERELYIRKIRPFMNQNIVKVLTGIRRCGKSVMLQLIQEDLIKQGAEQEQFLFVNFESKSETYLQSVETCYQHIKQFTEKSKKRVYLMLDEIQELTGWETMVNACMIDFDVDIYITGSNAKMLSGELATYLGGRYVEFKVYPFSYGEMLSAVEEEASSQNFHRYLVQGGMPFLYQFPFPDDSIKQYLNDIYSSIILKDIAERYKIRDLEQLKRIFLYFITGIGHTFSAGNIIKYLKNERRSLSMETVYNYIEYGKSACLFHFVKREDVIGKRVLQFQEKIYLTDHGMREAIYGNNLRDIDQILENIVYMELLRRGYEVYVGKADTQEVDFVAKKGNEKIYVQVAYLLADERTVEREFSVLEKIPDNYPKYVVTMDEISRSRNGIPNKNIRDFLLMDQW